MNCKIEGCEKEVRYAQQQVCQMHYFRFMRKGHYELDHRPMRRENEVGYQLLRDPKHPLAQDGGYVFEHRAVLFAAIGPNDMNCELCGVGLTWKTCKVDHIDCNVRNNERSNLRPTCNFCNTDRGRTAPSSWEKTYKITYQGVTLTPAEWARDPRVNVSNATIIRRMSLLATDEEALFGPKKTHNGKVNPRKGTGSPHRPVQARGMCMTLHEWERQPGVTVTSVAMRQRLKRGLDAETAIFAPPGNNGGRKAMQK